MNTSLQIEQLSEPERWIIITILVFIGLVGGLTNLIILAVAVVTPGLRKRCHLLVVNLAVIDCLVCLIVCPLLLHAFIFRAWKLSMVSCQVSSLIQGQNSGVSVLTNLAIAVNRCALAKSHKHSFCGVDITSTKITYLILLLIWFSVFSIIILPALGGFVHVTFNPIYAYCTPSYWMTKKSHWIFYASYTTICFLLIPMVATAVCYYIVYSNVQLRMANRGSTSRRRFIKACRRLCILFLAFLVCWLPVNVHYIVDPELNNVPAWVSRAFQNLFVFNSSLNPFLFAAKFPAFRKAIKKMFARKKKRLDLNRISTPPNVLTSLQESLQ